MLLLLLLVKVCSYTFCCTLDQLDFKWKDSLRTIVSAADKQTVSADELEKRCLADFHAAFEAPLRRIVRAKVASSKKLVRVGDNVQLKKK